MQHYGFVHVWQQGDFATHAIAVILLAMSVLSWSVIIVKSLEFSRVKRLAARAEAQFWNAEDFEMGLHDLGEPGTPFHDLATTGQAAIAHHEASRHRLHERIDPSDWLLRSLKASMDDAVARLQRGLAVLASIGSTAPFVGLFGTVWGIYHALLTLGASGQASVDQVAGPVGEALIMTAFGLFVAIPAVLGYNGLTRINKDVVVKLNRFAHGLHALLLTGGRPPSVTRTATQRPLRAAGAKEQ
jgi:biopolymer transport protein ExbB